MQRIESARSGTDVIQSAMLPLGGKAFVPPAYMQTTGDQAVQLNAANDHITFKWTPEADYALDSFSLYFTAVATEGNLNAKLHSVAYTGYESNGRYNGSLTAVDPLMTANNAPAANVVGLWDNAGANAEAGAGFEAFEAMDGSVAADNGTRSNAAPTAIAPIIWTLDNGAGVTLIVNKFRITSFNNASADVRAFPKAFTFWGSNELAPAPQTDANWTQLSGDSTWTAETDPGAGLCKEYYVYNATAYRHYRLKITDRTGVNAYVAIGELEFFGAQLSWIPGTELYDIGTVGSGAAADAWVRKSLTAAQQLQRGIEVCLDFYGTAAKDFSLSTRRWNTATDSMFPDTCETRHNLGTGYYTQAEQDSKPALLNIVINSTANHCPKLYYGRTTGLSVYLPTIGIMSIPQAGISATCDDLTASVDYLTNTKYSWYLYNNAGTLGLHVSATDRVVGTDGIEVKSGATSYRYGGFLYVINRVSTKQGPIDVESWRGIYQPGKTRSLGKRNPYSTSTSWSLDISLYWRKWMDNDDFRFMVATGPGTFYGATYCNSTQNTDFAIRKNGLMPTSVSTNVYRGTGLGSSIVVFPSEGLYTLSPAARSGGSAATIYFDSGDISRYGGYAIGTISDNK